MALDIVPFIERLLGIKVYNVEAKGDWALYRSITVNDTTPVGLGTPAGFSTNYHNGTDAKPTKAFEVSAGGTCLVRLRTNGAAGAVKARIYEWGSKGKAGDLVGEYTFTPGPERDGDGANGKYITNKIRFDTDLATQVHIVILDKGVHTAIDIDIAVE